MTSIGTEHPRAGEISHTSPLTNTLTRGDSIAGGTGSTNPLASPDNQPVLSPAGIHRGSINGLPGGGLSGGTSHSPVKESSYLARTASVEDSNMSDVEAAQANVETSSPEAAVSPPLRKEGIPIRRP